MPAESEKQRKAAGVALAARRGQAPKSSLKGASRSMSSMTEKQLRDYASKPRTTSQVAGLGARGSAGARHVKGKSHKGRTASKSRGRSKR